MTKKQFLLELARKLGFKNGHVEYWSGTAIYSSDRAADVFCDRSNNTCSVKLKFRMGQLPCEKVQNVEAWLRKNVCSDIKVDVYKTEMGRWAIPMQVLRIRTRTDWPWHLYSRKS